MYMRRRTSILRALRVALVAAACGLAASCGVYDDTSDCLTDLRLRLLFDYNMEFTDALTHEVRTAHICAYDTSGQLVMDKTVSVPADGLVDVNELKTEKEYTFVVWAEGEARGDSYTFGPSETESQLTATVKRTDAKVSSDMTTLFNGRVTGKSFPSKYGTTQVVDVPLVKDTKDITVVLQQIDGGVSVNPDDFTLTITDDNGSLGHDNSLLADETLTYTPWSVKTGAAAVDESGTEVGALVTEFTVNRLVKDGHNPTLTVTNRDGKAVLSIPLIDYFLLVKSDHYSGMGDQEYLDREDTYSLTFFINNDRWVRMEININSWRIVIQNVEA